MYNIVGIYKGEKEVIDSSDNLTEANYMLTEYKKAFGPEWTLWIEKQSREQ
jgi:hypothetical protein